ncbi:UNVERIFIED_CONTAM: hypothetical protein FKN15_024700 [Acipenser sinensis]
MNAVQLFQKRYASGEEQAHARYKLQFLFPDIPGGRSDQADQGCLSIPSDSEDGKKLKSETCPVSRSTATSAPCY